MERKVPRPKINPTILHNDLQIDSVWLLLSKYSMLNFNPKYFFHTFGTLNHVIGIVEVPAISR